MAHKLPKLPLWVRGIIRVMEVHLGTTKEKLEPFIRQLLQTEREWCATTLGIPLKDPQFNHPFARQLVAQQATTILARMDKGVPCPQCPNVPDKETCPLCKGTGTWHNIMEAEFDMSKVPKSIPKKSASPLLVVQGNKVSKAGLVKDLNQPPKEEDHDNRDSQTPPSSP